MDSQYSTTSTNAVTGLSSNSTTSTSFIINSPRTDTSYHVILDEYDYEYTHTDVEKKIDRTFWNVPRKIGLILSNKKIFNKKNIQIRRNLPRKIKQEF